MLSFRSAGITPSTIIWLVRSEIMSTPASLAAFTAFYITPDDPAPFPFFILLIDSLIVPLPIKESAPLILSVSDKPLHSHANSVFKKSSDNFSKLCSYCHHWLSITIIISWALLTKNLLISFDHLVQVTFLMILLRICLFPFILFISYTNVHLIHFVIHLHLIHFIDHSPSPSHSNLPYLVILVL